MGVGGWVLVVLLPVICSFELTSVTCTLSMITSMCQLLFSVVCLCEQATCAKYVHTSS